MKLKEKISFCKICFKEIKIVSFHLLFHKDQSICLSCLYKSNPIFKKFKIEGCQGLAIYEYDDFIKEKLYQLKGCFDIELAPIFLDFYRLYLKIKYFGYYVISGPSHEADNKERGFNQIDEIFKPLGWKIHHPIRKKFRFKQSDLAKKEREEIGSKLNLENKSEIPIKKKVLIVDDVMTTGSTIKSMIKILKEVGVKKIKVLVISIRNENSEPKEA